MMRFFSKNNQTILLVILISFSVGAMVSFTIIRPAFTKDMIKNAASIAGLDFDEKEIELMQDDLEDQVKTFQKNWESNLPNHVSPALVFNPIPQGFQLNTSQTPVQFDDYSNTEMPTSGPPKTLISDNGKQFASKFFQAVCSLLDLSNIFTSTYHPQTNGQVER